jgi:hypothetical protein
MCKFLLTYKLVDRPLLASHYQQWPVAVVVTSIFPVLQPQMLLEQ